jgi:hypothetical protein
LTASALDQSLGTGDLAGERKKEGRETLGEAGERGGGEGFLNTRFSRALPLVKEWKGGVRE